MKRFVKSRTTQAIFWFVIAAVMVVYSFQSFVFIPFASVAWLFMLLVLTGGGPAENPVDE